jgi:hypothetical protein
MDDLTQLDRNGLSWPYIAGFVDGEGHIRIQGAGVQVSVFQSRERGRLVFIEMQNFLKGHGIKSAIHLRKDGQYCLYSCGRDNAVPFMRGMLPYLRIKKLEVQDILRYLRLFPLRNRGPVWRMLSKEARRGRRCKQAN